MMIADNGDDALYLISVLSGQPSIKTDDDNVPDFCPIMLLTGQKQTIMMTYLVPAP